MRNPYHHIRFLSNKWKPKSAVIHPSASNCVNRVGRLMSARRRHQSRRDLLVQNYFDKDNFIVKYEFYRLFLSLYQFSAFGRQKSQFYGKLRQVNCTHPKNRWKTPVAEILLSLFNDNFFLINSFALILQVRVWRWGCAGTG